MAFWGAAFGSDADAKTASGIEPKRAFRFLFDCAAFDSWIIKSCDRPSFSLTEASHSYLNHTFYYPGRISWSEVSISLVDPASPDSAGKTMKWLLDAGYFFPESQNELSTIGKGGAVAATGGNAKISVLNADGLPIEVWTFTNPWIKSCSFSQMSYENDALTDLSFTMRYDFAKLDAVHAGGTTPTLVTATSAF